MLTFKMLRQQHILSTDEWIDVLEKQSNVLWQKMYRANGLGVGGHLNLQWQMLYHLKFELSRQDAFYIMFLILNVVKRDIHGIYL